MVNFKELSITLFCCPVEGCNKEYKSRFNLKRHVECNHLGRKPFTCEVCNRSFVSKLILTEHQFIHSGEKPYTCSVCREKFRHMSLLSLHKRSHEENYEKTMNFVMNLQDNSD